MKLIPAGATRALASKALSIKQNSPHIFFVVGVVGAVGATFLACRATLKLEETLDECKANLDDAKRSDELVHFHQDAVAVSQKKVAVVYAKNTFKVAKLYAPSAVLMGVSIAALTGSHIQLTKRNNALMAAYVTVVSAYESYRERVREVLGEEKELDLYRGVRTEIDPKTKEMIKVKYADCESPYARLFGLGTSSQFQKDADANRVFIKATQQHMNDRLKAFGYLYLNEAYEALGMERCPEGQVVGWIWNTSNGDGYVDFGLYEAMDRPDFNIQEASIWLDFNVDGDILKLML